MTVTVMATAARAAIRVVDVTLAGAAAVLGGCVLLARRPRRRRSGVAARPRLMAIDSWYSLDVLRARRAEHLITQRDLDGYFEHVWNVDPLVGADRRERESSVTGGPTIKPLTRAHTVVEGKGGLRDELVRLPHLNFVLAQVRLVLLLDRIIRREGIAIVRGDPYYHGLLALLLGALNRRMVEVRVNADHDAIYEAVGALAYPRVFRWRKLEQRVARFTLSRADAVVVGSANNREFAVRNGARPDRLALIGNWSMINPVHLEEPLDRQAPGDDFGLGDRPIVAFVGRLERVKHPEDVIVSVAEARRRHPRIAAVMVGEGAMRDDLVGLAAELGMQADVIFAGERDQRWIAQFLARATVVVVPLAGLALVESALSGTPIVAYDVEWHAELIRPGREGVLVDYRDTVALAAAICALIEDPQASARLARAARARALDRMQPARLLAHERAHAEALLGGGRAAQPPSAAAAQRTGGPRDHARPAAKGGR